MVRALCVALWVVCWAGLGLLGWVGSRPAANAGDDGFPHKTWESASTLEDLGWSTPRIAALKARVDSMGSPAFMIVTRGKVNTDEPGSRIGSSQWDALLADVVAARLR